MPGHRASKRAVQGFGRGTINRISIPWLKSGLPIPPLTPSTALVLETVGRRSGRVILTPMGYVRGSDGRVLTVAEHGRRSDWVRNALAAGSVWVWIGGDRQRGSVRVLDDADPDDVWKQMRSKLVMLMAKALAHEPKVVEIILRDNLG